MALEDVVDNAREVAKWKGKYERLKKLLNAMYGEYAQIGGKLVEYAGDMEKRLDRLNVLVRKIAEETQEGATEKKKKHPVRRKG